MLNSTSPSVLFQAASDGPQWIDGPVHIRPKIAVRKVAAEMILADEAIGGTHRQVHRTILGVLAASREFLPDTIITPCEWWAFCTARLGCKLPMGDFKQSEFWGRFVQFSETLLSEVTK